MRTNYIAKKLAKEADVGVLSKWLIHDRNDTAACRAPQIGERRRGSELLQQLPPTRRCPQRTAVQDKAQQFNENPA